MSKPAVSVSGLQAIKFPPLGSIRRRSTCKASSQYLQGLVPLPNGPGLAKNFSRTTDWEPLNHVCGEGCEANPESA